MGQIFHIPAGARLRISAMEVPWIGASTPTPRVLTFRQPTAARPATEYAVAARASKANVNGGFYSFNNLGASFSYEFTFRAPIETFNPPDYSQTVFYVPLSYVDGNVPPLGPNVVYPNSYMRLSVITTFATVSLNLGAFFNDVFNDFVSIGTIGNFSPIPNDAYHLVNITYTGGFGMAGTGRLRFYLDGVSQGFTDTSFGPLTATPFRPIVFGVSRTNGETVIEGFPAVDESVVFLLDPLFGDVGQFRTYNRALSAAEITDHFAAIYPTIESGLTSRFDFPEDGGDTSEAQPQDIEADLPVMQAAFTMDNPFGIYFGAPPTPIILPILAD